MFLDVLKYLETYPSQEPQILTIFKKFGQHQINDACKKALLENKKIKVSLAAETDDDSITFKIE